MRVLLLEDDPVDALALQRELGARYEIRTVSTLAEGLHALSHPGWQPDVVVTDLNLPDSEGARTLASLQAAACDMPIIVSTGGLSEQLRRQLDALGAAHLHDKNSGLSLLKAVLQQHQLFHLMVQTVSGCHSLSRLLK